MKTIPMIFNQEMVEALVDGRKTVTRRPVESWRLPVECYYKDERYPESKYMSTANNHGRWGFGVFGSTPEAAMENYNGEYKSCAPYSKGDLIWVRETFRQFNSSNECGCSDSPCGCPNNGTYIYKSNGDDGESKWKPSIHMPRIASRLTLRVTGVRCERIQSITDNEAVKEGVPSNEEAKKLAVEDGLTWYEKSSVWFKHIWNRIYSNWDKNPWVWVIEFEVIHKNIDKVIKESGNV